MTQRFCSPKPSRPRAASSWAASAKAVQPIGLYLPPLASGAAIGRLAAGALRLAGRADQTRLTGGAEGLGDLTARLEPTR